MNRRIIISEVEEAKPRIVAALFNHQKPLMVKDIVKSTLLSRSLIEHHLRSLVAHEIVEQVDDKFFKLNDVFYDDTLIEGLEDVLFPLTETIIKSTNIEKESNILEMLVILVALFYESNKRKLK